MRTEKLAIGIFTLLLMLTTIACAVPGFSGSQATSTPQADSDFLSFTVPGYTTSLSPGENVPGSRLEYIGQEGDAYRVRIDGQESIKRIGDSFTWAGIIAPGIYGEYSLRLTTALLGPLPAAGTVKITVLDWLPTELTTLPDLTNAIHYGNIPVIDLTVPVGESVLASNMIYDGIVTQGGTEFAQLTNAAGNKLFAELDSVVWTGTLRENVFLRYNLRVISFNENNIVLGGTAEIWLTDPTYP